MGQDLTDFKVVFRTLSMVKVQKHKDINEILMVLKLVFKVDLGMAAMEIGHSNRGVIFLVITGSSMVGVITTQGIFQAILQIDQGMEIQIAMAIFLVSIVENFLDIVMAVSLQMEKGIIGVVTTIQKAILGMEIQTTIVLLHHSVKSIPE